MITVVIGHVSLNDLPGAWRAQLHVAKDTRVTVRIDEEKAEPAAASALVNNPLFGMWQDRDGTADFAGFARSLRAPRYKVDGSRDR